MIPEFVRKASKGGWYLSVWAQPKAKKTEISGVVEGKLKIRVNAPPVENKANECLLEFLSKSLGVKKSALKLVQGETSREKLIWIKAEEVNWQKLLNLL